MIKKKHMNAAMAVLSVSALTLASSAFSAQAAQSGPVKVSMFTVPVPDIVNLNTNWFTKYVEHKFNMKIQWDEVASSDLQTKQSLLLESGKYPDVFWDGSLSPVQQEQYGEEGLLIPLNSLIKEYAPNLEKAIQTDQSLKAQITAPNGNIYGLPSNNYCWHCNWASKLWINTHALTQYGLKMPTTTAQFQRVLEVFKQHGLTPLTGSTNGWHSNPVTFLMNAFIYDDEVDYFYINNGKLAYAPIQPQWKQGLAYIHALYAKGLIDKGALTQDNSILDREVTNDQAAIFAAGGPNGNVANWGSPQSHVPWWKTVPPLKGPNGVQYAAFFGTPSSGSANAVFAITNKASQAAQIAVMKLVNFLYTPTGTETFDFGPEGKYWTPAKKGQKGNMGTQALFNTNFDAFNNGLMQNYGWNQMGPYDQGETWRNGQVAFAPESSAGAQQLLQLETMKNYAGHQPKEVYPGYAWVPPAEAQQYAMYQTNIINYVNQWMDEFIVGSKSLTTDWNTYIQGLNNLGLSQYLQMTTKYMGKPMNTSAYQKTESDVTFLENLK